MFLSSMLILTLVVLIVLRGTPAHTSRVTPAGFKMPEGFKALFAMAQKPSIQLWERDLTPLGIDGGEPIDTTTQFNSAWYTMAFRKLKKGEPLEIVCAYDPDVYNDIITYINWNQGLTFWFPSGDSIDFWGAMTKFSPQQLKIGEFPLANVTIVPSMTDDSNPTNVVESAPVYHTAPGT